MSDSESSQSQEDSFHEEPDSNSNASLGCNESNDSSTAKGFNAFANDGSFMEQFKRRMEEAKQNQVQTETSDNSIGPDDEGPSSSIKTENEIKKPFYSLVGKRRGGKILKTGMVKKQKTEEPEDRPKDAWSRYMAEVNQYKKHACEEDSKTRPLVK